MNLGQLSVFIHPLNSFKSECSPNLQPPPFKYYKGSELTVTMASDKTVFCQGHLSLISLGRDATRFSLSNKTIFAFKNICYYNVYGLFIILEVFQKQLFISVYLVVYVFYFSEFYFSFQQLKTETKKQNVFSIVTLLEFLLGQQCKSLDPSKLEKKRKPWGEILKSFIIFHCFCISFALLHSLYIFQLIQFYSFLLFIK